VDAWLSKIGPRAYLSLYPLNIAFGLAIFFDALRVSVYRRESTAAPRIPHWAVTIAFVLAMGFFLSRGFARIGTRSFHDPSHSMYPEIHSGDYFASDRNAYDTEAPKDDSVTYVKRIVGIPGDRIEVKKHELFVNGKSVSVAIQPPEADRLIAQAKVDLPQLEHPGFARERLGSREYVVTLDRDSTYSADFASVVVPPANYFVMGDNRDRSNDSRYWGYVPRESIVGKKLFRYWPLK
jgi:signal peptidase I